MAGAGHFGHPLMGGLGAGPRMFESIPNNPAEGGSGYFRRSASGSRSVFSPSRTRVDYTNTPPVLDMEPGGNPTIAPRGKAFLPDGRLVPQSQFPAGTFLGAPGSPVGAFSFFFWGIVGGAAAGAGVGALSARSGTRGSTAALGAGVGAIGAFALSLIIYRGKYLAG